MVLGVIKQIDSLRIGPTGSKANVFTGDLSNTALLSLVGLKKEYQGCAMGFHQESSTVNVALANAYAAKLFFSWLSKMMVLARKVQL